MARTLVVTTLHISDKTATKIDEEHGLDPEAVRGVVEGVGGLPFRWAQHPTTGAMRALVWTSLDEKAILVVLYPSHSGDAGEWHLGSAYPDDPPT